MWIVKYDKNDRTKSCTIIASYIANMALQGIYFDYKGNYLDTPKELPAITYDGIEYTIYMDTFYIACNDVDIINKRLVIDITKRLFDKINPTTYINVGQSDMNIINYKSTTRKTCKVSSSVNDNIININDIRFSFINMPQVHSTQNRRYGKEKEFPIVRECNTYYSLYVDVIGVFSVDIPKRLATDIPLDCFTYKDNIVSKEKLPIIFRRGPNFPNIASVLLKYKNQYYHNEDLYKLHLNCVVYEEVWENIRPRRGIHIKSDMKRNNIKDIINHISKENTIDFVMSELNNASDVAHGFSSRPNDCCIRCGMILCDYIYVIEIDNTHHWCFCRMCMTNTVYSKLLNVFNLVLLKVNHPTSIRDAVKTLQVDDKVTDLLTELCTKQSLETENYHYVSDINNYILYANQSTYGGKSIYMDATQY